MPAGQLLFRVEGLRFPAQSAKPRSVVNLALSSVHPGLLAETLLGLPLKLKLTWSYSYIT